MSTITICSSANFYQRAIEIQEQLEAAGFEVLVPVTATKMKESGDYDVSHYKTWFADANDYGKKAELVRRHFGEIVKGDAILVINNEKHGIQNYIGGNVLMEMSLAFFLRKPIFVLNDAPQDSAYIEEILGMLPVFLHSKIQDLPAQYEAAVTAAAK